MAEPEEISHFFVCVGAQKAGTTWLARVLSQHPEIFFTPVKEIHYFDHLAGITSHLSDDRRRSRYRKYHQRLWTQWHRWAELRAQRSWYRAYMKNPIDDSWYASLFKERGGRSAAGEATPEYAIIGEQGFRHIRRLAPDARVLYIMRNPVERAWSQILHHCRRNRLDARSLGYRELVAISQGERFEALADYTAAIAGLEKVFPDEQVWLGFYEDIHADRLRALEQICAFIGVGFEASWFPGLDRRYNISQEVGMPDAVRDALRERYRAMARAIESRVGRVPKNWREEFNPAASGKKRKTPARN